MLCCWDKEPLQYKGIKSSPTKHRSVSGGRRLYSRFVPTNLSIDHVAHGHTDLHPSSLDVVEIQMMKNGQAESWQWDGRSIAVGLIARRCVSWVITLKVLNYLPKKHRLNNFEDFLMYKKQHIAVRRTQCCLRHLLFFSDMSFHSEIAPYLNKYVYSNEWVWSPVTLNQDFGEFWWMQIFCCLLDLSVPVPVKSKNSISGCFN